MNNHDRKMHLNLFLASMGHHEASWRYPDAPTEHLFNFTYYKELVKKAEQAKMDSIFLADRTSTSSKSVKYGALTPFEPTTLLSALAVVTEKIGLIGTVSTSFNEPYNVARRFSSLDFLSNGRAGWNIITSGTDSEAQNFNLDKIPDHALRYKRAKEFLDVSIKLWDSWEDDAVILNKESGIFADSRKVHEINHKGEFFKVRGPLNISSSPQKRPVLVQAGTSENGKEFAATYAEAIFTAQQTFADAKAFYNKVKERVKKNGRNPDQVKILPGICPIIGETKEEVIETESKLQELMNFDHSLMQLSNRIGTDLTSAKLDEPLPELPVIEEIQGHKSRTELIIELAQRENLTLKQLLIRLAGGRGHYTIVGTPQKIADELEYWFLNGAADGFNIMPQIMNPDFDLFIRLVIPELQKRGLFRTEYTGNTLREHYGLAIPDNQFMSI
ncbi:LLM class flavin-dependent oxidoreductase [Metabacillus sediminilitoris]|uniref:LLM class flavin-dependent oxidoreductase n=1 Tax=Metabacillus sediminilitoris TaxID=2567941 RepID=A0A4V3WE65_9BACI|nr:LLM class flavin-dependent oxidoreductase [Metabacillus sediminilitoris]QGQ45885.1 NtaA/DmoA family FMN-dependent monooxygenase [Metabacillus sediminilitoris]THF75067.1 LLM class flavin-dependent oxidoreductase [Metabacillus sediminilitoris]